MEQSALGHDPWWIQGRPFQYQRNAVISGLRTAQPLEWGGIYFASLPEGALLDHVPRMIVEALGSDNLSRAVKMSVPCELSPAFYVPGSSDQVPLQESNPMPPLNNFSRAMSLQCSSHVMYKAEWVDYGDLLAFDPIHGQQWSYGMPPHDLEVLGLPPHTVELTEEHLAGAMSLLEKLAARDDRRSSVNVAIRRWMNSKQDVDFPDKFIELRIALEALYAKGGKGSLTSQVEKHGAWHLAAKPAEMSDYRTKLRTLYKLASDAIHNRKEIEFSDDNRTLLVDGQDLCRSGILKRLDEDQEPDWGKLILGKDA